MRIDPEYFQKIHLADAAHVIANVNLFRSFQDFGLRIDASAFYPSIEGDYDTGDLPFLRVADVDSVIDFESCTHIPAELCQLYPTLSKVKPGDIVFTKGGSVARVGLISQEAAVSRDLIFLNSSTLSESDYTFLYLYFQTAFFNRMLLRSSSQTAQPHLTITLVRHLPVFSGTRQLKERCVDLVKRSYLLRNQSIQQHAQAEQVLLCALGLADWHPPEPLTYTRRASEAFSAERLDSDYFAPARRAAIEILAQRPHRLLSEWCAPIRDLFDPLRPHGVYEVRNFDVTDALRPSLDNDKPIVPIDELGSTKKMMRNGDVAISRLRSYLRQIAVVRTSDSPPTVGSSEFIILRPREGISPELLMVFLRSKPVQTILQYCQEGNQHPRFGEANLMMIPLPDVALKQNDCIISHIQQAHTARQRAHALLEAAKRAVEIAIEDSEAAALDYLRQYGA